MGMDKNEFSERIKERIVKIYGEFPLSEKELSDLLDELEQLKKSSPHSVSKWDEQDIILITYGDTLKKQGDLPLTTLHSFLQTYLREAVNYVHILPFYPYSSDDGFSVIDYMQVNPELGTWKEVEGIGTDFRLMFDLVINHISQHSEWFRNFIAGKDPGKDFFIEADPETDLSKVVRPRSLPLLTECDTARGKKHVWTTFSADQIDLNFSNPAVLLAMIKVFIFYLSRGARIIRLDAIAFLWKEIGTSCLHLPQTHEVVKLMRDIADYIDPGIILLTETNVPNKENLSYFGEGDEADMVYQFSLPPLLLHALYNANSEYLTDWADSLSGIPPGCTFFNFTASHDGIGVRPLEGLIPPEEVTRLAEAMKKAGGHISTRRQSDGSDSPYELNITYLDALTNTSRGKDEYQLQRFIASQTLMMSFKGIPAFYIHSLLGTNNYHEGVEKTGMPRSVNRRKWDYNELEELLKKESPHRKILGELTRRILIRKKENAFHPDSPQKVIREGKELFVLCRGEGNGLVVAANLSENPQELSVIGRDYLAGMDTDLISGKKFTGPSIRLEPYQVCWLKET